MLLIWVKNVICHQTKGSNKDLIDSTGSALQQYRKLMIAAYFEGKGDSEPPPFTPESDWTPPLTNLPINIQKIIQWDREYFDSKFKISTVKPNLSRSQVEAWRSLQLKGSWRGQRSGHYGQGPIHKQSLCSNKLFRNCMKIYLIGNEEPRPRRHSYRKSTRILRIGANPT